jgi:putative transposase
VPNWQQLLRQTEDRMETIRYHVRTGRPWGTQEWVQRLEQQLQRPLLPRQGGWPKGRPRSKSQLVLE